MLKGIGPAGNTVFIESDNGELDIRDPRMKEQWDAQVRIEERYGAVQPGVTEAALPENKLNLKFSNKMEAMAAHALCHSYYEGTLPDGITKEDVEKSHDLVVGIILKNGWKHHSRNALDDTMGADLKKRSTAREALAEKEDQSLIDAHKKMHDAYPIKEKTFSQEWLKEEEGKRFAHVHEHLVMEMMARGIAHTVTDTLDNALPDELKGVC